MSVIERHVVISGGGTGVGAELTRAFRQAGAAVTIIGRRIEALREVADATGAFATAADVTDRLAVDAAMDAARATHGPITIAIANAGQAPTAPFQKVTTEDFSAALAVNLTGVFNLWQATERDMRKSSWGRLIAVASTAGLKGYPYVSPYCASKHGVIGLTRALAQEYGPSGITVNAICPGFIETPLLERSIATIVASTGMTAEKAAKSLMSGNPQRRFIETSEVAGTALWLCSDAAASVSGHALSLSGGEV